MDLQTIFDTSVGGVIRQGGAAFDPDDRTCVYLHPESGRRCGAGQLIPADMYDASIEGGCTILCDPMGDAGYGTRSTIALTKVLEALDLGETIQRSLICDLQNAHDEIAAMHPGSDADFLKHFVTQTRTIAERWGLSPAVATLEAPNG